MNGGGAQAATARPDIAEDEEAIRERYIATMQPLFLPAEPAKYDIVNYFSSLLRVVGIEDKGWDPYAESRALLEDLHSLMQIELPEGKFPRPDLTIWRLGLPFYQHIIEMDAPYEVLANLLRYRLGKGYSPNPYYDFLSEAQQKNFRRQGLYPRQKIQILRQLGDEAGVPVGAMFDEFFRTDIRNAISHSDFILTDEEFRCRKGYGSSAFTISLHELNDVIRRAKYFVGTFFGLEREARHIWGRRANEGVPYDPKYKGLMEVLVDNEGLMNGFKVHWPNNSESYYQRTPEGIDMVNCFLSFKDPGVALMVDLFARNPGSWSPLVERDGQPRYTPLTSGEIPVWRN